MAGGKEIEIRDGLPFVGAIDGAPAPFVHVENVSGPHSVARCHCARLVAEIGGVARVGRGNTRPADAQHFEGEISAANSANGFRRSVNADRHHLAGYGSRAHRPFQPSFCERAARDRIGRFDSLPVRPFRIERPLWKFARVDVGQADLWAVCGNQSVRPSMTDARPETADKGAAS